MTEEQRAEVTRMIEAALEQERLASLADLRIVADELQQLARNDAQSPASQMVYLYGARIFDEYARVVAQRLGVRDDEAA
jgi:hypothetical protein